MTDLQRIALLAAAMFALYGVLALGLTLWGVHKAANAGPASYTADRPTLRPGCMARFGEIEKTCCHGHAK